MLRTIERWDRRMSDTGGFLLLSAQATAALLWLNLLSPSHLGFPADTATSTATGLLWCGATAAAMAWLAGDPDSSATERAVVGTFSATFAGTTVVAISRIPGMPASEALSTFGFGVQGIGMVVLLALGLWVVLKKWSPREASDA